MARSRGRGFGDVPGASYDEARRNREEKRRQRFGSQGQGATDYGFAIIFRWFLAVAIVVAARLLILQVIDAPKLAATGKAQRTNTIALHAKRGTIYDRNGNVLAVSEDCKTIYANPKEISDVRKAARALAKVFGGMSSDYIPKLRQDASFVYVRRQVDTKLAKELQTELEKNKLTGIYFLDDTKRVYPYKGVASQVLGVVGVDGEGLSGLELYYEDILHGSDGEMIMERGLYGEPIAGATAEITPAKNGADIMIGLDINIQQVAEEQITEAVKTYTADSGSVMVTDPTTGEILAACSTPLLDLTDLSEAEDAAYTLRPVTSSYEPGSIFKVLTAAIGVDNKLMEDTSTWTVPAEVKVGDNYVTDVDNRDYTMTMSLREIMRRSSNTGMALIGQQVIGPKRFSQGVDDFHIGHKTGIDYPGETKGIVKTMKQYDGSTLGNMAFGQGLAIPMVQMVEAVGSVANGGTLYTPHFLKTKDGKEVEWKSHGKSVSSKTCAMVTDIMRTVVDEGTAMDGDVEGYDVAAKTGTGQQVTEDGSGYKPDSFVSSLIGFANASDPRVLVYVGLNGTGYHGSAAGPAFSAIMSEALSDMGVRPASDK